MDDTRSVHIKSVRRKGEANIRTSKSMGTNSYHSKDKFANVEKLFLQLLTNYPEGSISIIDKKFQVIYTGGELYQQLQKDPMSWSGKNILSMFPPTLEKRIQSQLSQVFFGKIVSDLELHDCCFAGHSYTMDAFPLVEEDKSVKRAGIIIRNITRLKQAEEGFRMALEKEKELGELKSRFVSMASHEFRTPLSTILTSAYLLSKYITTEEQSKRDKHLERIISSVNTLTDILNDFLSLGKMEEGKILARPTTFNIRELITGIVNEMVPIEKKGQTIQYEHNGEEMVILDKGLLKQIVSNLLSNAIKFSSDETQIEVKTVHHADALELKVKDYGMGISKGDQKHLFERFFRGANAMNIQGTGLGLHIVARYAELMNGNVTCKSELEKGSEFIVTLKQPPLRK
jgi:signal transduction histidine kinase